MFYDFLCGRYHMVVSINGETMKIVEMIHSHTEILHDLEKLCFSKPWSRKALEDQVDNPRAYFVTAMEGEAVLGYGGMHCAADECYIDNIAVFRRYRGRGLGTAIIERLAQEARRRGCRFISLEVRVSNKKAIRLYERCGFQREGERKNFYSAPMEDGLILTRWLKARCR